MKSVAAALPRKKKTENLFSGGKSGAISVSDDRSPRLFSVGRRTRAILWRAYDIESLRRGVSVSF